MGRVLRREPTLKQQRDAFLGYGDVNNHQYEKVDTKLYRCIAKSTSMTARQASHAAPHPTRKDYAICWKYLPIICVFGAIAGLAIHSII